MPTPDHDFGAWSPKLFGLLSVIVGIIVIVAILCWPGGFSVVAQGHGSSIELKFTESRVDLGEMLDRLLSAAGGGNDSASRRRLVARRAPVAWLLFAPEHRGRDGAATNRGIGRYTRVCTGRSRHAL